MLIIGITGPSGAGKGAVSEILAKKYAFKIIDADKVYHNIISAPSECVKELVASFGEDILNEFGGIDRRSLSKKVFGEENRSKLLLLNIITHKYVISEIEKIIFEYKSSGVAVCVIDAPLLIEAGVDKMCDHTVAVVSDKNIRAERIAKRDGIDKEAALLRINSQKPDSFYTDACDFILTNDLQIQELESLVDSCLRALGVLK